MAEDGNGTEALTDLTFTKDIGTQGYALYQVPEDRTVASVIAELRADPTIEAVQPNYVYRAMFQQPNDPNIAVSQWWLDRIGAGKAWDTYTGTRAVSVCVIDSGIDLQHPDLAANIDPDQRLNIVWGAWDSRVDDGYFHGTHISGIIGAAGNNGLGTAGVNWRVNIVPVRGLDDDGMGSDSRLATGVAWCRKQGIKIINASWGGPAWSYALEVEIAAFTEAGGLFVTAAGNFGYNNDAKTTYPANSLAKNVITVAATDDHDQLGSFSNYGAARVHLAAPGVSIGSTVPLDCDWPAFCGAPGGGYYKISGTSMATATVSGAAALLLGASGGTLTATQIKALLLGTVDVRPQLVGKVMTGGVLNLGRAMDEYLARARPSPSPSPPPTVAQSDPPAVKCSLRLHSGAALSGYTRRRTVTWDTKARKCVKVPDLRVDPWAFDNRISSFQLNCSCTGIHCAAANARSRLTWWKDPRTLPGASTERITHKLDPSTSYCSKSWCQYTVKALPDAWKKAISAFEMCLEAAPPLTTANTAGSPPPSPAAAQGVEPPLSPLPWASPLPEPAPVPPPPPPVEDPDVRQKLSSTGGLPPTLDG